MRGLCPIPGELSPGRPWAVTNLVFGLGQSHHGEGCFLPVLSLPRVLSPRGQGGWGALGLATPHRPTVLSLRDPQPQNVARLFPAGLGVGKRLSWARGQQAQLEVACWQGEVGFGVHCPSVALCLLQAPSPGA